MKECQSTGGHSGTALQVRIDRGSLLQYDQRDTSVHGPAVGAVVVRDRSGLAVGDHGHAMQGDAPRLTQVSTDGFRATLTENHVVGVVTHGVGMSLNLDKDVSRLSP